MKRESGLEEYEEESSTSDPESDPMSPRWREGVMKVNLKTQSRTTCSRFKKSEKAAATIPVTRVSDMIGGVVNLIL